MTTGSTPTEAATPDPLLRQRFLQGMSQAAATVNIVTTDGPAGRHGITVSAMVSVSADTPQPTLLVCLHHASSLAQAVLDNGVFCVNILRDDQAHLSESFAGRSGARGGEKFECATWTTQVTGAPRLVDPLVAFDCRVTASSRVGSHYVIFGAVQDIFLADSGAALLYANRGYAVPVRYRHRTGEASAGQEGRLALGCFHTFAPWLVPPLVSALLAEQPGVAVTLVEGGHGKVIDSLRRGDIEVALLYDFALGEDLAVELLTSVSPYVLLPASHPLASRPALELKDLVEEPLILLDVEPSGAYFLSLFAAQGLDPQIGYRTTSLEMVRGFVAEGLGYSLLALRPAADVAYDGRPLVTRPLNGVTTPRRLVLVHLARRTPGPTARAFADRCRAYFRAAPL